MTDEEIDKLDGPELNAAVADEVMGWDVKRSEDEFFVWTETNDCRVLNIYHGTGHFWCPDRDIAQAKKLLAKLWETGHFDYGISGRFSRRQEDEAFCVIEHGDTEDRIAAECPVESDPITAECVAICRCSLKAARWLKSQKAPANA